MWSWRFFSFFMYSWYVFRSSIALRVRVIVSYSISGALETVWRLLHDAEVTCVGVWTVYLTAAAVVVGLKEPRGCWNVTWELLGFIAGSSEICWNRSGDEG